MGTVSPRDTTATPDNFFAGRAEAMTAAAGPWRRRADVAWIGDDTRVIAARTSPPDQDGPRILEGAAALVWLGLEEPHTAAELAAESGQPQLVDQTLTALADAGLIEPV
jgi:hypothetical protein